MEPNWLSDEEMRAWMAFNVGSRLIFEALDQQLLRDADMPHTYYGILVMLSEAEGRSLRMSQLARLLRYSRSRLTHAITSLESRGWVRREECPSDGRGLVAMLTDEGFDALKAAAPGHVAEVRRLLLDGLSADQIGQLRDIFQPIVGRLAPETP